jgi:hypothetical protein
MKFLQNIWKDVTQGENLDLYATVGVSLLVIVLNIFGVALSLSASLSLAILALLAIAILGNRHRLETIISNIKDDTSEILYTDFPDNIQDEINEKIKQSKNLLFIGIDLDITLSKHYPTLEKKLVQGERIKALLVNPDSPACEMVVRRSYRPNTIEALRSQIQSGLSSLQALQKKTAGELEIRILDYPLTHGGIIVDADTPKGVIYTWHYSFRTHRGNRPKYVLRASDGYWYDFFKEEAYALWESAIAYQ